MTRYDYLIVGGGIAGTTAAETIRKYDKRGTIALISEEPEPLYSRLLLHYYLKGLFPLERLYLRDEASYKDKQIDFFKGKKAIRLDSSKKAVVLNDSQALEFGKLLIATGGYPEICKVKGVDKKGVFYFRTIEDAKKINERIEEIKSSKPYALIIGSGFACLNLAASLVHLGLKTTIIVSKDYFWQGRMDKEPGKLIEDVLRKNGIEVLTGEEVDEIQGGKEVRGAKTKSGRVLKGGIIGIGIGIDFDLDWIKKAQIATDQGVLADQYLKTNIPGIFAAGDICQFWDVLFGKQHLMANWMNAQEQGKVAGQNMIGQKKIFKMVSSCSIDLFGNRVSFIGITNTREATSTIVRGSGKEGSAGSLFFRNGQLIGASLINRTSEQRILTKLIENKMNLKDAWDRLSDPNFDLNSLFK